MRRKVTKLDAIAEQLIKEKKGITLCPNDYSFITTASPLIWQEIKELYDQTDLNLIPPSVESIKQWFYKGCPDMALATLFLKRQTVK